MSNPAVKLRSMLALLFAFLIVVVVQMGVFIVEQVGEKSLPDAFLLFALADVAIGYAGVRIVWRCLKQAYLSRKWLKHFRANRHAKLSKRLNAKYRDWGTEILVVRDDAFVALTLGMLRPKIVLSTALFEMFDDKELEAVLLHERYHCRNNDGPKMFLSALLADAFGYWPLIHPILRYYRTWKELFADRYAIREMGTELYLGSVLLKLSKLGHPSRRNEAGVHFADAAMNYRMMQVLEPDRPVKVPTALLRPLLASCSLLLLLMLGGDS